MNTMIDVIKLLVSYIKSGNSKDFFELASQNPESIYGPIGFGPVPLNAAIYFDRVEIIDFLLEKKVDVNKHTPLFTALKNKKFDSAKKLLNHGARLDEKDDFGNAIWQHFMSNTDAEAMNFLIENCIDLLDARALAQIGMEEKAIRFLELQIDHSYIKNNGGILMYYSCVFQLEKLFLFLENSGDFYNYYDPNTGDSLLHIAASKGGMFFVRKIISHVDVNSINMFGQTALMAASSENRCSAVEYLLLNGANKTLKDDRELSVYDYAQELKCSKCLELLQDNEKL